MNSNSTNSSPHWTVDLGNGFTGGSRLACFQVATPSFQLFDTVKVPGTPPPVTTGTPLPAYSPSKTTMTGTLPTLSISPPTITSQLFCTAYTGSSAIPILCRTDFSKSGHYTAPPMSFNASLSGRSCILTPK